jgi:predicted Zn-dependent protease
MRKIMNKGQEKAVKSGIIAARTLGCLRLTLCCAVLTALACEKTPDNAEDTQMLRYARSKSLFDEGKFDETIQMTAGETFLPSVILRGKAYFFSGRHGDAEREFRAALKKRPTSVEASLYLARVLRETGRAGDAETIVRTLLTDDPQNIRALRLAAELEKDKGTGAVYSENALSYLDRAVEASMEAAMAILERARHKWLLGRDAEALADLAGAKALFPAGTPVEKVVDQLEATIEEFLR